MRLVFLAVGICGCKPAEGIIFDLDAEPAAEVVCAVQDDNVLRADCVFDVPFSGPRSVTITRPDGSEQTFTAETESIVTIWDLVAETAYPWFAEAGAKTWSGELVTPDLPASVAVAFEDQSGEPTWDHLGLSLTCGRPGHMAVVDRSGTLVWYQNIVSDSELGSQAAEGFRFTDENTVLAVTGRQGMREFDMAGNVLMEVFLGGGYDKPVHHDAHRDGEWTWVLNATEYRVDGTDYIMDGLYVHDRQGNLVAEWALRDHVVPTGNGMPGAFWTAFFADSEDFSHGNGIWTDGDDLILSFRGLSTLIAISGDPDAADFGDIRWVMDGAGDGRLGSDFELTSAVTPKVSFKDQHGPNIGLDGRLSLFDNRRTGQSRAIQLAFDPESGSADIVEAWDLEGHCQVQGSAYALPNGNVVATCAVNAHVLEFTPGQADPVWEATVACQKDGLFGGLLVRAQPVNFGIRPTDPD